jgi:hypothetical protein
LSARDIENCQEEFVITSGVPEKGLRMSADSTVCRLMFRRRISKGNTGELMDDVRRLVKLVMETALREPD